MVINTLGLCKNNPFLYKYPGDKYTVLDDHTFTAIWKKNADPVKPDKHVSPKTGVE